MSNTPEFDGEVKTPKRVGNDLAASCCRREHQAGGMHDFVTAGEASAEDAEEAVWEKS